MSTSRLDTYQQLYNIMFIGEEYLEKHKSYATLAIREDCKEECIDNNYRYIVFDKAIAIFDQEHLKLRGYLDELDGDEIFLTVITMGNRSYILTNMGLYAIYPDISYERNRKKQKPCCMFPKPKFRKESLITKVRISKLIRVMYTNEYAYVYYIWQGSSPNMTNMKHTLMRISFAGNVLIHPNLGHGFIEANRIIYFQVGEAICELDEELNVVSYGQWNSRRFDIAHNGDLIQPNIVEMNQYVKCRSGPIVCCNSGTVYYQLKNGNFVRAPGYAIGISQLRDDEVLIYHKYDVTHQPPSYIYYAKTFKLKQIQGCNRFLSFQFRRSTLRQHKPLSIDPLNPYFDIAIVSSDRNLY